METMQFNSAILLALAAAITLYLLHRQRGRGRSFPPGPWQVPLLGNIFNLDLSCPWDLFTRWKSEYGQLVGLNILGTRVVILNSHEAIVDLLEKRSNIYSHRPIFTVLGELMNMNKSIMLISYGTEWKECRRLERLALSTSAVKRYEVMQERVAATLCMDLIDDAANFYNLVRLNSARVVLHILYGISPRVIDREYIAHAEETMRIVGESSVLGTYLCDFIPIMKYLPRCVSFHRKAVEGKMKIERMVTTPFLRVKREIDAGTAGPSLLHDLLTSIDTEELNGQGEERIMWTTASMYAAGAESTAGTINVFLIAMALYPEALAKAHKEIDSVIGDSRLPRLSDKDELPYTTALVKEVMRWHPILPLGISRRTAADDVYDGYFIPKDTVIVPNIWQIAFSQNRRYPPDDFIPERFIDSEVPTTDPALWAFGFGRRLCPGKALGETSVWILIATLLAVFDVSPPDENAFDRQYGPQAVSVPKRFACRIVPRTSEKVKLVQEALL